MIDFFLRKASALLFKSYLLTTRLINKRKSVSPYLLKYAPNPRLPKIIHVNGNFIIGGSTQLIVDLVERTSDRFYHQVVVPFFSNPLPYQPIHIHQFSQSEMTRLYSFLKEEKPALIHIHYWVRHEHRFESIAMWYGAVFKICEELQLPIIQNINVPTSPYPSLSVRENVFVSRYVLDHFNQNNPVSNTVVYPGSDFSHFNNDLFSVQPVNTIGMVYRLDRDKLDESAIEVFISVVKKNTDITCYIIGGGHYLAYYQQRVREEGLMGNFVFTGYVSYQSLPDYYKKIAVIVAPVHDESFGQVTPFAMSMGLAVAGYDTGALSEILGDKKCLVPFGDKEALSAIITHLLHHPQQRLEEGKKNRERAHKLFSVEQMIEEYVGVYHRIDEMKNHE